MTKKEKALLNLYKVVEKYLLNDPDLYDSKLHKAWLNVEMFNPDPTIRMGVREQPVFPPGPAAIANSLSEKERAASMAAECFMCQQADRGGCLECRTAHLIRDIRTALYEKLGAEQNREEWEERALEAEAKVVYWEQQAGLSAIFIKSVFAWGKKEFRSTAEAVVVMRQIIDRATTPGGTK